MADWHYCIHSRDPSSTAKSANQSTPSTRVQQLRLHLPKHNVAAKAKFLAEAQHAIKMVEAHIEAKVKTVPKRSIFMCGFFDFLKRGSANKARKTREGKETRKITQDVQAENDSNAETIVMAWEDGMAKNEANA
jgi:hypothetical protein